MSAGIAAWRSLRYTTRFTPLRPSWTPLDSSRRAKARFSSPAMSANSVNEYTALVVPILLPRVGIKRPSECAVSR